MTAPFPIPPHVPADLAWDHSLTAFLRELDDPFLAGARLHEGPDIIWARDPGHGRPGWVITSHAWMQEAYADHERFSSRDSIGLPRQLGHAWPMIPIEVDPPLHASYRLLLNRSFTPKAVHALEGVVQEACDALLAGFESRGECEFVGEFASRFPTRIFLGLLGLPDELAPQFLAWEHQMVRAPEPAARRAAGRAVIAYLEGFVREQRGRPRTELLAAILEGRIDGRAVDDGEIMGMLFTLYLGGLDSVASTLGWVMRRLALEPSLQAGLRARPQDIPLAVDELLRAYPVVNNHRVAAKDCDFHGVALRRGDNVLLPSYVAGRDPETHPDPHAIRLDRREGRITFGSGRHICLGMHLARREVRIVIERFLAAFENIRPQTGEAYAFDTQGVVGVTRLPLGWD
jgi:cytochrome P450